MQREIGRDLHGEVIVFFNLRTPTSYLADARLFGRPEGHAGCGPAGISPLSCSSPCHGNLSSFRDSRVW